MGGAALGGGDWLAVAQAGIREEYRWQRVGDNVSMLSDAPTKILDGLMHRLEGRKEHGFQGLWVTSDSLHRHLRRRLGNSDVDSLAEYEHKTYATLRDAQQLTVVQPTDEKMRITGKIAMISGEWIVLLSDSGAIVTSYPRKPGFQSFEQRHISMGDAVNVYTIADDDRARIARLLD